MIIFSMGPLSIVLLIVLLIAILFIYAKNINYELEGGNEDNLKNKNEKIKNITVPESDEETQIIMAAATYFFLEQDNNE